MQYEYLTKKFKQIENLLSTKIIVYSIYIYFKFFFLAENTIMLYAKLLSSNK